MGCLPFNKSISGYIVDGEWSNWSDYGDCSVTCGNGSRTRSRECNAPEPSGGGSPCSGESNQTDECKEITCPGRSLLLFWWSSLMWSVFNHKHIVLLCFWYVTVHGGWSEWLGYDECSVTCGQGSQTRIRECNSPEPSDGGFPCVGESSETKQCQEMACPGIMLSNLYLWIPRYNWFIVKLTTI